MFFYEKITITDKEGNVVTLEGKLSESERLPMVTWKSRYKGIGDETVLDRKQVHVINYVMSQATLLNMKEVLDGTVTAETSGKIFIEEKDGKFTVVKEKVNEETEETTSTA